MSNYTIFKNGTNWVRADFHLHTIKDKEFSFKGEQNNFVREYIETLKKTDIRVGVITNHNKFDFDEFKALRKNAIKEEIFLLPGIELSVNDGPNGIHTLIVFSDEWIENNNNYVNQFLNIAFEGKTPNEYENENGRCSLGLIDTIKKLEGYHKDFFIIFAHVEQKSGLWNELNGGRIEELAQNEFFCRKTLGFQKVCTHNQQDKKCRVKVKSWLGNHYPAEVEGSDCKSIDEIGNGKKCYLKIGDFVFGAIKYALMDFKNRIGIEPVKYTHSFVKSISFEGGVLNGKKIDLSPELNSLIGIRGSGKSSILEAVRYVLDIPFGDKVVDDDYKTKLVQHTLGSGGKIILKAIDRRGQEYEIRRILNEQPDIYIGGVLQPGVSIRETILFKPIYFGQKDLSSSGEGFEKDLVEKFVGENLRGIRSRIEVQKQRVADIITSLKKLENIEEKKKEYDAKKRDANYRLEFYKKHNIEDKLQKQIDFDNDSRKTQLILKTTKEYLNELSNFVGRFEDELASHTTYESKRNKEFFADFLKIYGNIINSFLQTKKALEEGRRGLNGLMESVREFDKVKNGLKEEFAEIERKLSENLKEQGKQAIRPDEFLKITKVATHATQMLNALEKQDIQQLKFKNELVIEFTKLNDLWREEYIAIQKDLEKVNKNHSALQICVEFKKDKKAFGNYMKDIFRGSNIRANTFDNLTEGFTDFGAMSKDLEKAKKVVGVKAYAFEEYFNNNMTALLTWQVPNKFTIKYRDKELKQHSLGQRASALILFVLSQKENDLILIDQPEDDLDNQTIYEDVIKLISELKKNTQFIFATLNANIPVLGDSERIFACAYEDETIDITDGNIDCPVIQKKIVDIMEGGTEAFNRRKEIYQIWKPQNF